MKIMKRNRYALLACFLSLSAAASTTTAQLETVTATAPAEIPVTTIQSTPLLGLTRSGKAFVAQDKGTLIPSHLALLDALCAEPELLQKLRASLLAIAACEVFINAKVSPSNTDGLKLRHASVLSLLLKAHELKQLIMTSENVHAAFKTTTSLINDADALEDGKTFTQKNLKNPKDVTRFYGEVDAYVSIALAALEALKTEKPNQAQANH